MNTVTRFAPSPTGFLHLGHAYSALVAWSRAREAGGRFLLRIEDIDPHRCRPEFEVAIREDLAWLGLTWEEPVRRQSEHLDAYREALRALEAREVVYPCFCTRKEIAAEIADSGAAPHGPDGPTYPGTCRRLSARERRERMADGRPCAMRLHCSRALEETGPLSWSDCERGAVSVDPGRLGDVVLARKETPTSYHLSVTVDDALQGVTLVTRGEDLRESTHVHRLLIELLALPVPVWMHHRLLLDDEGRRLSKRHQSLTLRAIRASGRSAESVREEAGFPGRH